MKTAHRTVFFFTLLACCVWLAARPTALAQSVPELLNYQGVLRQGDGTPAPAGYKDIEFRIYDAATGGHLLWGRTHRVHLDNNGLFNVVLMQGGVFITTGNPSYTNLSTVFTSAGSENRFIELTVSGSTPIMPRQRFVTTAYAFLAGDVAQARQNFTVQGALTVQQSARVQALTVDQDTTVGGSVTVSTNLTVARSATIGGSLTVTNDLTVKQNAFIGHNLTVTNDLTAKGQTLLNDTLTVCGNSRVPSRVIGNAVWSGGYLTPHIGRLFIGDGTGWQFHFSRQVDGAATDVVSISDTGTMDVGGNVMVHSNMAVFGGMSVNGAMLVGSTMIVGGTLIKAAGSFRIDHPLDPANKYLQHSFVESPDMMNVYNGNITTDAQGDATVVLPDYFEALNQDYRYQLTVIGQFAQAIVATEIQNNRFTIKTDKTSVKVSWQVTGIRRDPYANDHRIQVETDKATGERGSYSYPSGYAQPASKTP
jgi:hypothetical protein